MKNLRYVLILPLLSVNTFLFLMGGCFSKGDSPYCTHYNRGKLTIWDNANTAPHVATESGVIAKALFMQLKLKDTLYLCARPLMSATSAAYARKALPDPERTIIDSVQITSSHDFDAAHPAGTNLMDLFNSPDMNAGIRTISRDSATYYLMHAPDDTGTHIFTIHAFSAKPSQNFTVSSAPVKLLL